MLVAVLIMFYFFRQLSNYSTEMGPHETLQILMEARWQHKAEKDRGRHTFMILFKLLNVNITPFFSHYFLKTFGVNKNISKTEELCIF
jgi:hypothetical protein